MVPQIGVGGSSFGKDLSFLYLETKAQMLVGNVCVKKKRGTLRIRRYTIIQTFLAFFFLVKFVWFLYLVLITMAKIILYNKPRLGQSAQGQLKVHCSLPPPSVHEVLKSAI